MHQINDIIQSCTLYKGLRPLINTHKCPLAFSYFLAANLPLILEEKLNLLKTPNTIQRLRSIYTKLHNSAQQHSFLRCSTCALPISSFEAIFTVPGAEGITGAYVNEYGVIHQTITVSNVNHAYIRYQGTPHTKDSWFTGYAWTIAYCQLCHSHLGWKFTSCDNKQNPFWGFTSSAVTTKEAPLTPHANARIQRLRFLFTLMGSAQDSDRQNPQLREIQETFIDYLHASSNQSEYDEESIS